MPIDRRHFTLCNELGIEVGDRVWFTKVRPGDSGEGRISLIWFGVEEAVDIVRDDGTKVTVYPGLGDTIEILS